MSSHVHFAMNLFCNLNQVQHLLWLLLWSFYNPHVHGCDWPRGVHLFSSQIHTFPVHHKVFFHCDSCTSICDFTCWFLLICVWNLLMLLCFCWSLGCALDCCPLSRHCPLDPKAVWLPLQATVPMATFHSHFFSIWLWHIHENKLRNNVNTDPTHQSQRVK